LESDQCFSDLIFGGGLGDIADIDEVRTKVFIVSSVFSKELKTFFKPFTAASRVLSLNTTGVAV